MLQSTLFSERSTLLGFATFVFYLYAIAVPIGLVLLGLWLMRYMGGLGYAREKSLLFTAIVMACLTFITFSIGVKLDQWRSPQPPANTNSTQVAPQPANPVKQQPNNSMALDPGKERPVPDEPTGNTTLPIGNDISQLTPTRPLDQEQRLELFEADNYPDLYEQRMGLLDEIKQQNNFLARLRQLAEMTPKQRQLLVDIYHIRYNAYQRLQQRNVSVSQHLREFWAHYNTGNSHDATTKFTKIAPQLTKKIKESRGQLLDSERQEEKVIAKHLRQAGLALKNNKLPAHQAGRIKTYTPNNRKLIVNWLSENDLIRTLEVLERLRQQQVIIRDRYKQVTFYQQRYPDLKTRLDRTLKLWAKAQESNYYAEYRLLYAAESRFIVDYMNLSSGKIADQRLNKDLNAYTEFVAGHAEDALEKAEQAYKPGSLR